MKCMYYLSPSLLSTHQISEDLRDVGVGDWNVHVIAKDEAGLNKEEIQSSNWLETTDLLRDGFIGANIGFIIGVLIAGSLFLFEPFGPNIPNVAFFFMVVLATGFGAWVGGLTGIDSENQKLKRFHDEIEGGQYLLLIYAHKGQGEKVKAMMRERHSEAQHVATDRHFVNPFSRLERRRRKRAADQVYEK